MRVLFTFVVVSVLVVVVWNINVFVVEFVFWLPSHFVLFLQSPTGVGEPRTDLKQKIDIITSQILIRQLKWNRETYDKKNQSPLILR